jgi:hypothetical protein
MSNLNSQQSDDYDLELVDLSSPPANTLLVPEGTTNISVPPGFFFFLTPPVRASNFAALGGIITPSKPINAIFLRNDTGQGKFPKVASIRVQPQANGSFGVQIDKDRYPNLFPGFFVVGIRNLKINPTITVVNFFGRFG